MLCPALIVALATTPFYFQWYFTCYKGKPPSVPVSCDKADSTHSLWEDELSWLVIPDQRGWQAGNTRATNLYTCHTDEQRASMTFHSNGVGFRANHAKEGARLAKWILSGRHLTSYHLTSGRNIAVHYTRQLHEIAVAIAAIRQAKKVILGR